MGTLRVYGVCACVCVCTGALDFLFPKDQLSSIGSKWRLTTTRRLSSLKVQGKMWFKSQKHGNKGTYYMTRTKKASVFREDLFGEAGENMLKAMCWPEQALICLRYGVETSEGSLMGQNNTEEKHLQIESVWKRCPLHLVGGFPGQGTANRLRLPTGLMTPETHIFSDLISSPTQWYICHDWRTYIDIHHYHLNL